MEGQEPLVSGDIQQCVIVIQHGKAVGVFLDPAQAEVVAESFGIGSSTQSAPFMSGATEPAVVSRIRVLLRISHGQVTLIKSGLVNGVLVAEDDGRPVVVSVSPMRSDGATSFQNVLVEIEGTNTRWVDDVTDRLIMDTRAGDYTLLRSWLVQFGLIEETEEVVLEAPEEDGPGNSSGDA